MASLSTAAQLLGAEGNLHTAKDPTSAVAELCAGTAENEKELETSEQMGMAGSEMEVMLPSDEGNGVMHTEVEKVANSDTLLLVSPVLPAYDLSHRRVSESRQILI